MIERDAAPGRATDAICSCVVRSDVSQDQTGGCCRQQGFNELSLKSNRGMLLRTICCLREHGGKTLLVLPWRCVDIGDSSWRLWWCKGPVHLPVCVYCCANWTWMINLAPGATVQRATCYGRNVASASSPVEQVISVRLSVTSEWRAEHCERWYHLGHNCCITCFRLARLWKYVAPRPGITTAVLWSFGKRVYDSHALPF